MKLIDNVFDFIEVVICLTVWIPQIIWEIIEDEVRK